MSNKSVPKLVGLALDFEAYVDVYGCYIFRLVAVHPDIQMSLLRSRLKHTDAAVGDEKEARCHVNKGKGLVPPCKVCIHELVGSSGSIHHFRGESRVLQCEEEWEMETSYYPGPHILKKLRGKNSSFQAAFITYAPSAAATLL